MSEPIKVITESTLEVTPEILAKAFWNMSDYEQAEFFEALHDEVSASAADPEYGWRMYELGEIQWCYMARAMSTKAKKMYMALSGFAYQWWPQRDISYMPKALAGEGE